MAQFRWSDCTIVMLGSYPSYEGTREKIERIPQDEDATIAFVHEYVHYLQLLGSIAGFRLLGELLDFGIHAALLLSGIVKGDEERPTKQYNIAELLQAMALGSGRRRDANIDARAQLIEDELRVMLLGPMDFSLELDEHAPTKQVWEIHQQNINYKTYSNTVSGFVVNDPVKGSRFRPITPGMLAEGMARRIDRWLAMNSQFEHEYPVNDTEDQYYNGIFNLLGQKRYETATRSVPAEVLTVIVCSLALATGRPDLSAVAMFTHLERGKSTAETPEDMGADLLQLLGDSGLLTPVAFTDVMGSLAQEWPTVMEDEEYQPLYQQLVRIRDVSVRILEQPAFFADPNITWPSVRAWMEEFSIPPVGAKDGPVEAINGLRCSEGISKLMQQIWHVCMSVDS